MERSEQWPGVPAGLLGKPVDPGPPLAVGPSVEHHLPAGIPGLFRAQVAAAPHAVAVVDEQQRLTYIELDQLSDVLAEVVAIRCAGTTGAIAVRLHRSVELLVALLGVLKAGCWYLPVGLDEPAGRTAAMIEAGRPLALITDTGQLAAEFAATPVITVPTTVPRGEPARPVPAVGPDQPVYLLFTSGSTGIPKGALVGNAALGNRLTWMARHYQVTAADRVLQKTPVTFDVSGWEFFLPLITGGCCVFAPEGSQRDPATIATLVRTQSITLCHFVPSMLEEFVRAADPDDCQSLRHVFASGEPLTAALAHRFRSRFPATLHNLYGPTETAIDVTHWTVPPTFEPTDAVPIGEPIDNVSVYVLDAAGRTVPAGEPGELWIGGIAVGLGYVGKASRSGLYREAVGGGRLYRTGDRVVFRGGVLHYFGRTDDQVKVRGVRIEPGEVEQALCQHPRIRQAVVAAVSTAGRGTELVAGLVPIGQDRVADLDLRRFLAHRLPPAYLPTGFRWLDRIPMLPSGKADRRALRDELAGWWGTALGDADAEPGDQLTRLWWSTLGATDSRDETAGFVSLGGHSLLAMHLIGMAREQLGVDIQLGALLRDNASLAGLRRLVAEGSAAPVERLRFTADRSRSQLAPPQRRLWLLSRSRPDADAYNVVGALRLRGDLVPGALRRAVEDVIARHDALRAEMVEPDTGEPTLRYVAAATPPLHTEQAAALAPETIERFVRRLAAGEISLNHAPMARFGLLTAGTDAVLAVAAHHIIVDQQSVDLIFADLATAYAARARGTSPQWPPAPSHADYATALAAAAGSAGWQEDLEFWRRRLTGAPGQFVLPFTLDGAQPPGMGGTAHPLRLGADRTRAVDAMSLTHAVTPVTLFGACLAAVLARWCGRDTLVLGTPASRRRTGAEHGLVGFLVDTLPIRLDVAAQSTFAALLQHTRDRLVGALTHSRPPFDDIVAALGLPPSPNGNPLFDVWINDLTHTTTPPPFPGLAVTPVRLPGTAALFALNLYLHRDEDGYLLELVRATDRVPAEVATALLEQCALVLDQVSARPEEPLTALVLHAGRPGRRSPAVATPRAGSVLDRVRASAATHPAAAALRSSSGVVTYGELAERVTRLAETMIRRGVRPADVVEIRARRCAAMPVALLGTWAAGAVAAIVDAALPDARRAAYTALCRPRWTVDLPDGNALPVVGPGVADPRPLPDTSHVLFTSGAGGHPAGVRVGAAALDHTLSWYLDTFAPTSADRTALLSGAGHDPVLRDLFGPLCSGGSVVLPDADTLASPTRLRTLLAEHEVTILHATPALLELLLAASDAPALPRLRMVASGGAALSVGLLRRLHTVTGAQVVNAFGTTETPQITSCLPVSAGDPAVSALSDAVTLPVGSGVAGVELVVTRADGTPCAMGELGEVVVRGPAVALGYLAGIDHPDVFLPDGGVRTGDLGRLGPWGGIWLAGRVDRTVSVDGFRVALEEIETAALRHPDVARAVASLVDTPVGGMPRLHVVLAAGRAGQAEAIRAHLRGLLPAYAVPPRIAVVADLATDANLKVAATQSEEPESPVAGTVDAGIELMVGRVTAVLDEVLGRSVGDRENFFDAGLTSIGLLRLHDLLSRRLAVDIPVTALFAHVNAWSLARFLAGDQASDQRPARRPPAEPAALRQAAATRTALRHRISGGREAGQ